MPPRKRKTHADKRLDFCIICLGRSKVMRPLNETLKDIIVSCNILGKFDINDERLPSATCAQCRKVLYQSKHDKSRLKSLTLFDHSSLPPLKPQTRTQSNCDCFICSFCNVDTFKPDVIVKTSGRPRLNPNDDERERGTTKKICTLWYADIARGKPHDCC